MRKTMSKKDIIKLPSLSEQFDAPEDYYGVFGFVCGFSGDSSFFDDAANRFTDGEYVSGKICLVAMLQKVLNNMSGNIQSGVYYTVLPEVNDFKLLHAKVALLYFKEKDINSTRWKMRLVVSTGNWTKQTGTKSLDLFCQIEVDSNDLSDLKSNIVKKKDVENIQKDCADIKAAWSFLEDVQKYFNLKILTSTVNGRLTDTAVAVKDFKTCVDKVCRLADESVAVRFIDNRKNSLLDELLNKLENCKKTNYLFMGSGFYQSSEQEQKQSKSKGNDKEKLSVPLEIIEKLKKEGLFSGKYPVEMFVNRSACQNVAKMGKKFFEAKRINVWDAKAPETVFGENATNTLHAKFIFSTNINKEKECKNAWLYLGSGNFTPAGFTEEDSKKNLEAGMVVFPKGLHFDSRKNANKMNFVENLLPILRNGNQIDFETPLDSGKAFENPVPCIVPPITWLVWKTGKGGNLSKLCFDENECKEICQHIELLDFSGNCCEATDNGFLWKDSQPAFVTIRWDKNKKAQIPVIDEYGRIATSSLLLVESMEEALKNLMNFPFPPEPYSGSDLEPNPEPERNGDNPHKKHSQAKYPIRNMMEFLEKTAQRQVHLPESYWDSWLNCLGRTLVSMKELDMVKYFREMKINPLSPLYVDCFRPEFAENGSGEKAESYEKLLHEMEIEWNVNGFDGLL